LGKVRGRRTALKEVRCCDGESQENLGAVNRLQLITRAKLIGISIRITNQVKRMTGLRKKMYERKIVIMDVLDIPLT
jgi:hypothetical protein